MSQKNSRKVEIALQKRLNRSKSALKDVRFFSKLASETAMQIKTRTRLGKSAEKSGSSKRLKGLASSYKEIRRKNSQRLSNQTTVSKSNLTATGQMLNSLFGIFRNGNIIIDIKANRGKDLTGKRSNVTNKQLIDFNEDKGRRFFDVTKFELNDLTSKIREKILNALAKK